MLITEQHNISNREKAENQKQLHSEMKGEEEKQAGSILLQVKSR